MPEGDVQQDTVDARIREGDVTQDLGDARMPEVEILQDSVKLPPQPSKNTIKNEGSFKAFVFYRFSHQ
ncbi:hypothetical protein GCM10027286_31520 [Virgibacillus ainsalahensis]